MSVTRSVHTACLEQGGDGEQAHHRIGRFYPGARLSRSPGGRRYRLHDQRQLHPGEGEGADPGQHERRCHRADLQRASPPPSSQLGATVQRGVVLHDGRLLRLARGVRLPPPCGRAEADRGAADRGAAGGQPHGGDGAAA